MQQKLWHLSPPLSGVKLELHIICGIPKDLYVWNFNFHRWNQHSPSTSFKFIFFQRISQLNCFHCYYIHCYHIKIRTISLTRHFSTKEVFSYGTITEIKHKCGVNKLSQLNVKYLTITYLTIKYLFFTQWLLSIFCSKMMVVT